MVIFVIPVPKLGKKSNLIKKSNLRIFPDPKNAQKSILVIKNNLNDYIISKTLFSEKVRKII